jgi:hypothetical protein
MNSTHSSKLLALVLVAALLAQGAVALSVDGDGPDEVEVGTDVDHTVTLENLHQEPQVEQWTLEATTELEEAQWTITYLDPAGEEIETTSHEGGEVSSNELSTDNDANVDAVEVRVRGAVPSIDEYTYPAEEMVTVMTLTQQPTNEGVTEPIATLEAHAYTDQSQQARDNLDAARDAIDTARESGASVSEVESTFQSAVSSYENGNFENANRLANQARESANSTVESSQQTQTILYAVGGIVVLALIVGGFLWYRSRQDTYDKLG